MGLDLEKRLASELNRLEDDRGPDGRPRSKQQVEQLERIADELKAKLLGSNLDDEGPGKRTLVDNALARFARLEQSARRAREGFDAVPWQARPAFDAYRTSGLRDVLARIEDRKLRRATVAAADPAIAKQIRENPAAPATAATPAGQAMWRAAERRAATLYRHAQDVGEVAAEDPIVDEALQRCGSGHALPAAVRKQMEAELGVSLARVRVHTDPVAAAAARAVRASAFTVGEDIFFAEHAYAPDSREGQKLLAHELTHVVQGYQGRTAGGGIGISVSQPGESLEREAEAVAERIATRPAAGVGRAGATRATTRAARARGSEPSIATSTAAPSTKTKQVAQPISAPARSTSAVRLMRRETPAGTSTPSAAPQQPRGDVGPNGERAQKPKLQIQRDRATERSQQDAAPKPADARGEAAALSQQVDQAGAPAVSKLQQTAQQAKAAPPGKKAADAGKAQGNDQKAQAAAARKAQQDANAAAAGEAEQAPAAGGAAGAEAVSSGPVRFKAISDWSRYMPEALPDQDDRERKRILGLVQKQVNDDRRESADALNQLRQAQLAQAASVRAMAPRLQGQVKAAEQAAIGQVNSSEASQTTAVQSHIAGVQAQVRAHAAQTKQQIATAHSSAIAAVNAAKQAANQKLAAAKTKALGDIDQALASELVAIAAEYAATRTALVALGSQKAGQARGLGTSVSLPFEGEKLEAARKAAQDVANEYAAAMPQEATKAADDVCKSQPQAEQQARKIAADQKKQVEKSFTEAKKVVDQAAEQAITAANTIKQQATSQVDSTGSTTASQLSAHGASQVGAIRQQAQGARRGITSASAAAQAAVTQSCAQAAAGIEKGARGLVKGALQIEAPNPEETRQQAREGIQQINQGSNSIGGGLSKSATQAASGMTTQASEAASDMQQTAAAAQQTATQMGAGAQQSMTQIGAGASQGLQQVGDSYKQTADQIAAAAETGMNEAAAKTGEGLSALTTQVKSNNQGALTQITGGFNQAVPSKETEDILANAQKAADAVKPWWQKALAVVVSIVVAIVVVVVVTALIVTTGPVGAILVGAAAGALGSVLGQMASNLVLGNGLTEGITWQTVALGAVGGAVGAGFSQGVSAGARALATGGGRFAGAGARVTTSLAAPGGGSLGGFAIKTGVGVTGDFVSDTASQLIVTGRYEFSMENLATSLITNSVTSTRRYEGVQERFQTGVQGRTGHVRLGGPDGLVSAHGPGTPAPSAGGSQVGRSGPHPTGPDVNAPGGGQSGATAGGGGAPGAGAGGGQHAGQQPGAGAGAGGAGGAHADGPGAGQAGGQHGQADGPGAGQSGGQHADAGQNAGGQGQQTAGGQGGQGGQGAGAGGGGADAGTAGTGGADTAGASGAGAGGGGAGAGGQHAGQPGAGHAGAGQSGAGGQHAGQSGAGAGAGQSGGAGGQHAGQSGAGAGGGHAGQNGQTGQGGQAGGQHAGSGDGAGAGAGAGTQGGAHAGDGSQAAAGQGGAHAGDGAGAHAQDGHGPGAGQDGGAHAQGDGPGAHADGPGRPTDGPAAQDGPGSGQHAGQQGAGQGAGQNGPNAGQQGAGQAGQGGQGAGQHAGAGGAGGAAGHGAHADGAGGGGAGGGGAGGHAAAGDGAGAGQAGGQHANGDGAGAGADSAAASALGDLGYPNATRAKADQAAGAIESGGRPAPDSVRDTAANQQGLGDLARVDADPNLSPTSKTNIRRDVADQMRSGDPTGNLPRDVQNARTREQQRVQAEQAAAGTHGEGATHAPDGSGGSHPTDGSPAPHAQDGTSGAHAADGAQGAGPRPADGAQGAGPRPGDGPAHGQDGAQGAGPRPGDGPGHGQDRTATPENPAAAAGIGGKGQPLHGGGLADPSVREGFSNNMRDLQQNWSRMQPAERQAAIRDALNAQMRAQGLPDINVEFVPLKGRNGELRFESFTVAVDEGMINSGSMSRGRMKGLVDTLLHEARHGEQWYMMARHLGGQGHDARTIAAHMGIPEPLARAALADTRPMTPDQAAAAQRYYDSVYGADAAHRNKVLGDLDSWNPITALDAYRKYRNLPEEADAWAVGGESGGHYGNTTPNFFQRTWNRIQGNDPMTGRPTGPARPPTTGGPESSPTTGGPARPPATSGPENASTTGGPARPPAGGDPSVPRQAHADLDSLYRDAAVAQRELSQVTTSVAEQLGGRPMIPDRLKGRERAQQKIDADYDGDPSRITDLARSSIEFDNPQQIRAALEQLRTRGEFVRIKDRFERPADGYRDVMINMRMSNGHIVEVQLHLKAILDVKNGPGHALYEQIRNIDAAANKEGRPLTPDESARKAQLVAQSRALYDAAFEQSQGGPSPDQPAPPHGDASSSPTSMTGPPASDASRTDAAPPQGEGQSTHGQPQGELPQGDRGPTGTLPPAQRPRRPGMIDPGNKDLPSGRDAEGGTADGTGRMVRLRDPQRYSKFIQDASPLHKAISPQQRYEVIQSFPVVEIYSAPGHQNLRRPESMLGMSESMTKKGTGSIFDGAEPIKLNIFTDTVNGQVVVKSIEVTDGNHRLAAGLHSGKWTSIKDIPQHYLAIEVNGFDTHGKQNPRWIPLEVVQQAGIPRDQWFEVPADWGAKGPTAQVRGDVSSLDEAIPQKFRGVTLDKVIERSLERVNGDEEHGGPNPRS